MASVINRKGSFWVQYSHLGKRHTIRLPSVVDKAEATIVSARVQQLLECYKHRASPSRELRDWTTKIGKPLRTHLQERGLLRNVGATTVADLCVAYEQYLTLEGRTDSTMTNNMLAMFSFVDECGGRHLDDLTPADSARLQRRFREKLAETTWTKRMSCIEAALNYAVSEGWIRRNPFKGTYKRRNTGDRSREAYIPADFCHRLIKSSEPNLGLAIALARFGGLRNPSETQILTSESILDEGRMLLVKSPKTRHHEGGAERLVPVIEDLRTYLLPAQEGPLLPRFAGKSNKAIASVFRKLCIKMKVDQPPKPFVNMRASWVRDMRSAGFNPATVAEWAGHSVDVAINHYARVAKDQAARDASEVKIEAPEPSDGSKREDVA